EAKDRAIAVKVENNTNLILQVLLPLIPWLLIFGFIWFFVFRQLRNSASAGGTLCNFGRSRHRITSKEHTNITFDDVAGIEEAKEEVMEIVEFLKNPKKFQRLGGRIPRGVLLVGEPGTGKTLLAKAIAGEAEVPFFSISGSLDAHSSSALSSGSGLAASCSSRTGSAALDAAPLASSALGSGATPILSVGTAAWSSLTPVGVTLVPVRSSEVSCFRSASSF